MDPVTHILDTHAVIWAYDDSASLGRQARAVIVQARPRSLGVSDLTLFEIAMLVGKRKLELDLPTGEFLTRVENDFAVLPVGASEAELAVKLALEQADPFDRAIVATALCAKVPLVTKDRQISASKLVPVVW